MGDLLQRANSMLRTKRCRGGCGVLIPTTYKEGPGAPWKKSADYCLKCQGRMEAQRDE